MIGTAIGSVLLGLEPLPVVVTADVRPCDPSRANLTICGSNLPEGARKETRVRLRSAIGYDCHTADVTIAPRLPAGANTAQLDLAIAAAIMRGMGARVEAGPDTVFLGELALDGRVRPVRGALCHVLDHVHAPIVGPEANAWELGLVPADAFTVARLADLSVPLQRAASSQLTAHVPHGREDLPEALRPVLDACQGRPRVLLVGPPGSGKTMIARRLATLAPPLRVSEGREVARIYSAAGLVTGALSACRPLRAPHHTVSICGLLGSGGVRPGEATLAHLGVLFLDELPEFRRTAIEALADHLQCGVITFPRSTARFPAAPIAVVGAANPCPCGYRGSNNRACRCEPATLSRYLDRLAALTALLRLERIDVPPATLPRSEVWP